MSLVSHLRYATDNRPDSNNTYSEWKFTVDHLLDVWRSQFFADIVNNNFAPYIDHLLKGSVPELFKTSQPITLK